MIELDIVVDVERWDWRSADARRWRAAPPRPRRGRLAAPRREDVEVSVLLTDDAQIRELNRAWRGKDKATNVLSFPAPEQPGAAPGRRASLGDIALAYETVAREAEEREQDPGRSLRPSVVHGVLHLLGYDHEIEAEAEIMEALEVEGPGDPWHRRPLSRYGSLNAMTFG